MPERSPVMYLEWLYKIMEEELCGNSNIHKQGNGKHSVLLWSLRSGQQEYGRMSQSL